MLNQFKIDVAKLKHEWKTAAVAAAGLIIGFYDIAVAQGLDWSPLIPNGYNKWFAVAVPFLMLALRRWRNYELDN